MGMRMISRQLGSLPTPRQRRSNRCSNQQGSKMWMFPSKLLWLQDAATAIVWPYCFLLPITHYIYICIYGHVPFKRCSGKTGNGCSIDAVTEYVYMYICIYTYLYNLYIYISIYIYLLYCLYDCKAQISFSAATYK